MRVGWVPGKYSHFFWKRRRAHAVKRASLFMGFAGWVSVRPQMVGQDGGWNKRGPCFRKKNPQEKFETLRSKYESCICFNASEAELKQSLK